MVYMAYFAVSEAPQKMWLCSSPSHDGIGASYIKLENLGHDTRRFE